MRRLHGLVNQLPVQVGRDANTNHEEFNDKVDDVVWIGTTREDTEGVADDLQKGPDRDGKEIPSPVPKQLIRVKHGRDAEQNHPKNSDRQ